MQKKFTSIFLLFFAFNSLAFSQILNVLSERGKAAADVKVEFRDKSNTIVNNADGTFRIHAKNLPDTLVFSGAGYEPYKVVVTEKNLVEPNFEVVLLLQREAFRDAAIMKSMDVAGSISLPLRGSRSSSADDRSDGVRDLGALFSEEAAEYDTVITFEPETYEEKVEIVRRGEKRIMPMAAPAMGYSTTFDLDSKGSLEAPLPITKSVLNGKTFLLNDSLEMPAGASQKSRLLTAGEVNDFLKWKMWEDLTEDEFKAFGEQWGIAPKERFCVQLRNQRGDAVVGMPVELLDRASGIVAWRAVSDNTGKAELWGNLFTGENTHEWVIAGEKFRLETPLAFQNGINRVELETACNTSEVVEIAFVVDATGSMSDEIEFLKLELEDVIRGTFDQHADLDLRAASVFYRDLGDAYVTRHVDFNDDLLKVLNFIKLQSAGGGGDTPEALDSALSVALRQLRWSADARTRLLFLVSDAPPHDFAKSSMETLIAEAAALGVRIIPLACSGTGKSYEYLQRSMALATNGTYACLTNHSGVGGKHEEPTTDAYKVELLNTLLQRLINQSVFLPECSEEAQPQTPPIAMPVAFQPDNFAGLKAFPNPTSGRLTVELNGDIETVFLTDFTGKILERLPAEQATVELDLRGYPSATYFIAYFSKEKKRGVERVVLQR